MAVDDMTAIGAAVGLMALALALLQAIVLPMLLGLLPRERRDTYEIEVNEHAYRHRNT